MLHELARCTSTTVPELRSHGLIIKDGAKMSKSRATSSSRTPTSRSGAPTRSACTHVLGPFQEGGDFRDTSIIGVRRFLDKLWTTAHEAAALDPGRNPGVPGSVVERKLHQTIKKVTTDHRAARLQHGHLGDDGVSHTVRTSRSVAREAIEPLIVMVAPYAPPREELWSLFGHERSIFTAAWPVFDERLTAAGDVEVVLQVNGKVRGRVTLGGGASEAEVGRTWRCRTSPFASSWTGNPYGRLSTSRIDTQPGGLEDLRHESPTR